MIRGYRHLGPDPVALRADVARDARPGAPLCLASSRPIINGHLAPTLRGCQAARTTLPTGSIRQPLPIKVAVGPVGGPSSRHPKAQNP